MTRKVKLIIVGVILAIFLGLSATIAVQNNTINSINQDLSEAVTNYKAYENENSILKERNIQFELTVDRLNSSKDSVMQKLNEARKQLRIKDNDIKNLEYLASTNRKVDSIYVRDTIFAEPAFRLDTLVGDKWAKVDLSLKYPNEIIVDYSFNNSTIILAHTSKETVNPPKKCWIGRLFQKKHTVVTVDVIHENPYCETKSERHIEIVK